VLLPWSALGGGASWRLCALRPALWRGPAATTGRGSGRRLLPISLRESRFSLAYSHPNDRNLMMWRP
jgi:hypothetical protein